ncbi:MAG: hypothetical protein AAB535_00350 [Patescibacteria group bacterium]
MKNFLSANRAWILVLALAFLLRTIGIHLNPVGLSHDDELNELINAKSLAIAGVHAPGHVAGVFTPNDECPGNCIHGELGPFILIPWMRIFPLDIFWSKIPFIAVASLIVFSTGKLFENLSKNRAIGLFVGTLVAINPWAIHFGRTAYFTTFSYAFYLLAAYFFTRKKSYRANLFYGALLSIIASLFYFGTKPILPLIIIWGICYNLFQFKKHYLKFTALIISLTLIAIVTYSIILSNSFAGRRIGEINIENTATIVNQQRRVSLEIPLVRDLFINKYIVHVGIRIEKFIGFFSPTFLYVKSEGSTDLYYDSNHAYNYLADFAFLIFGVMALATSFPTAIFVLSLLLISVVPAAIKITGDTIYTLRAGLAYPILTGVSGWGIYYLFIKFSGWSRKIVIFVIILIYTVSLSYFLTMYWYRTPFDKSMGWYFHKRAVANYITRIREKSDKKIIVVTAQPADTFNEYVFFGDLYNTKADILDVNKVYDSQKYEYKNTKFVNNCDELTQKEIISGSIIFIEQGVDCLINQKGTAKIANPRDGGGIYDIVNENLCAGYPKARFPYPRKISDFSIERLSDSEFCKLWITNPD